MSKKRCTNCGDVVDKVNKKCIRCGESKFERVIMEDINIPELPAREPTPPSPVEKTTNKFAFVCIGIVIGIILTIVLIHSEISPQYLKDQTCNAMIENASNESFINGSIYGATVFQNAIINQSLQCEPIPFGFQDETYNLVLIECLNLNNNGGTK